MRLRRLAPLMLLLAMTCKGGGYEGHGVSWKPPHGVSFEAEATVPGATAAARFSGGVQLAVFPAEGMPGYEALEDLAARFVPEGSKALSKRTGSLPAGKVARLLWSDGQSRTLLYYLPDGARVVVLTMTAAEGKFGGLETHLDLSLNTLKLTGA